MKKKYFLFLLLSLLTAIFVLNNTLYGKSEEITSPGKITREEANKISNRTIRDFALYCSETNTSPHTLLQHNLLTYNYNGERFISIDEHQYKKMPVLGLSSIGCEGVVTYGDSGEIYSTKDKANSTTYDELARVLIALYEE